MNEPGLDRRSLTPCLDENGVDDENCGLESSKEIELSDISDIEDENWQECNKVNDERRDGSKANGDGSKASDSTFKKVTRNTRGRNYRDNIRRKPESGNFQSRQTHQPYRTFDNKRRDMKRYNVRNVVASREFTISRSRSKSPRIESIASRHRSRSFSPKRDMYRRKSVSPAYYERSNRYKSPPRKYSPLSSKHSKSPSLERHRKYKRSPTPEKPLRRSRSRHKSDKIREYPFWIFNNNYFMFNFLLSGSVEKSSKRKKHKLKDHQRKHKKSRSKSKRLSSTASISSEPARSVKSLPRQILNVPNASLPQENIKVILKNEDAIVKRQKLKKRDKKGKKEKIARKEVVEKPSKTVKDPAPGKEVSKEVFASGDNILISVCFNNNNNGKPKEDPIIAEPLLTPIKTKSKKRQPSPASSVSSTSFEESERRQRKHKRKKVKNKREHVVSKAPETPPIIQSKRKSDMKPIAIIDLEKSPGKEITQSPREVIVLSDSDGDGKKRDCSKDVIIIDDIVLDKNISTRNQAPESPPALVPIQPVLKFALKSKSNILPFNLLHDHAEETEEQDAAAGNSNSVNDSSKINQQSELANNLMEDKGLNQRDAYDPFEPTKSGSVSPVTPPPPNDVSSSSDMMKNKIESPVEKIQTPAKEPPVIAAIGSEEHLISSSSVSIWSRKEFDKKQAAQPTTPPLPPIFNIFSGSSSTTVKQHVSLYDGIYGNDLKTPVLPSPAKSALKSSHDDKNINKNEDDDERTPYSPSSDGYDFEPPPATNTKHSDMDTQNNDLGSGSSYTFSSTDDGPKSSPLKLTASTLKTFNSTHRSTGPVGLQFVNKTELSIFENYLPASQQKSPLVKRQSASTFLRSKMSRFTNSLNENGSPARGSMNYHEPLKPPVIGEFFCRDIRFELG